MRNLQKILALVLALVMSLSLMATAGAREFTDGDQIDETFAESVDVLTGLEVFQGYPSGDFQPKGDITRAEVAAIIYRIATGDVGDTQVGIYADYNKFSDVPSDNWAAGYINYCANAEYIKGRGDGKFYPQDKVTGYEALAMILRVVGYDKNGEFTGADWQVQTAATANQRKVTKNVNAGTLGNPASRETVAELLCQAILIEKVSYTLAFGYQISTDPKDTIAYETFEMQRLEGVVTGNEYADLDTHQGTKLTAGQSRLELADGEKLTLTVGSDLDDIGESCRVYVVPGTSQRYDLVTADVYATDKNTVYGAYDSEEGGEAVSVSAAADKVNIVANDTTEHYINFDQAEIYTTKIHLRYEMEVRMSEYDAMEMLRNNGGTLTEVWNGSAVYGENGASAKALSACERQILAPAGTYTYKYARTINAFKEVSSIDWDNMYNIFVYGDKSGTAVNSWIRGQVYVGTNTQSATSKDISDEIDWNAFVSAYLVGSDNKQTIGTNSRGYWLKVIDNDGDGIADYAFQTRYTVAIANNVADGKCTLDIVNKAFNNDADAVNQVTSSTKTAVAEDVVSGDKVLYALIDGVARVQKADTVTTKVTSINRASSTATLEDGTVKNQSGVHTHSIPPLNSYVTNMVLGTNYELIYDRYGNIAAFTEGTNGEFVLITDGWSNPAINGTEYSVRAYIDGSLQTQNITTNGNLFVNGGTGSAWSRLKQNFGQNTINNNNASTTLRDDVHTIVATLRDGILMPVDKVNLFSQTNRMIDMDNNVIPGKDNITAKGNVYTTDYVDGTAYMNGTGNDDNGKVKTGVDVAALTSTVYYYVYNARNATVNDTINTVVRQYIGFNSIPTINKEHIEDVYVIGTRASNAQNTPYYTAQVVVVELNNNYNGTNMLDSEIVFVPSFGVVDATATPAAADGARSVPWGDTSWGQGVENVTMIRETGKTENVYVDTAHSVLDWYDQANGGTNRSRTPGLYYMSESEYKPGTFVLVHMSAEQIRGDGRLMVGFTNKATATMANQYATIDRIGAPTSTERLAKFDEARAMINPDAAYYNLSYRANNYARANLEVSTYADVLAQEKDRDVYWDVNVNQLNETWNNGVKDDLQRNEVLVVCNAKNGSIIYAVSFNEYNDKGSPSVLPTRDVAQNVWRWSLASKEDTTNATFYGVGYTGSTSPTTGNKQIVVPYNTAKTEFDKNNNTIFAQSTNVQSWTLVETTSSFSQLINGKTWTETTNEPIEPKDGGAYYILTINYYNGGKEVFELTQEPHEANSVLALKTPSVATITLNATDKTIQITGSTNAEKLAIKDFVAQFEVKTNRTSTGTQVPGAKIKWTFTSAAGNDYTVVTDENGVMIPAESQYQKILDDGIDVMTKVIGYTAVVIKDNGDEVPAESYYSDLTKSIADLRRKHEADLHSIMAALNEETQGASGTVGETASVLWNSISDNTGATATSVYNANKNYAVQSTIAAENTEYYKAAEAIVKQVMGSLYWDVIRMYGGTGISHTDTDNGAVTMKSGDSTWHHYQKSAPVATAPLTTAHATAVMNMFNAINDAVKAFAESPEAFEDAAAAIEKMKTAHTTAIAALRSVSLYDSEVTVSLNSKKNTTWDAFKITAEQTFMGLNITVDRSDVNAWIQGGGNLGDAFRGSDSTLDPTLGVVQGGVLYLDVVFSAPTSGTLNKAEFTTAKIGTTNLAAADLTVSNTSTDKMMSIDTDGLHVYIPFAVNRGGILGALEAGQTVANYGFRFFNGSSNALTSQLDWTITVNFVD